MLSFDVSAIDIVLIIVVFLLLSLQVNRKKETSKAEPRQQIEIAEKLQETKKNYNKKPQKSKTPQLPADFQSCAHHFGYLKGLQKNKPVPDECFGCPKVMQCLFPNE